jgi:hypothetical protein
MRGVSGPCFCLLGWLSGSLVAAQGPTRAELLSRARDTKAPVSARDRSLQTLLRLYPEAAEQAAPELLGDPAEIVRFRAAWILADAGREDGLTVLRAMASDEKSELAFPAEALGRLKDPGSHELLRGLLKSALATVDRLNARSRTLALAAALAEFADGRDVSLLLETLRSVREGKAPWALTEQLGRAGGQDAVAALEEVFDKAGAGWTGMAAGLGLARCGLAKGRDYVKDRLSDTRMAQSPESMPTDAGGDDPRGPRAGAFLLEHIGVAADEPLVPLLLKIASEPGFSDGAKARAWLALFRVDAAGQRAEVLALAWRNLQYDGAARFVVVHDEEQARTAIDMKTLHQKPDGTEPPIGRALSASARERRRWRESRAYAF